MPPQRKVTQREIARIVGVSQSVVATVLGHRSNNVRVSAETREKIVRLARDLGYRPNKAAQLMRGARSGLVGLVKSVTEFEHGLMKTLHLGEAMARRNYKMISLDVLWNYHGLKEGLGVLADIHVEGLFVGGTMREVQSHPLLEQFASGGIPIVHLDASGLSRDERGHGVFTDNRQGMRDLVEHLLAQGLRRIALVTEDRAASCTGVARVAGYEAAMQAAGMASDLVTVSAADIGTVFESNMDMGRRGIETLLNRPRLPEAVCFQNDLFAMGGLAACTRHGLSVPGDLVVTGFDNHSIGKQSFPSLTSVEQPLREIAEKSAELMAGLISGEIDRTAPRLHRLPCRVHPRESSRVTRSARPLIQT